MERIRLETETREVSGTKILDVEGEIDVYTAPQFKEAVNKVIADGQKHLIINMAGITYMDSSGFGTLVVGHKEAAAAGRDCKSGQVQPGD